MRLLASLVVLLGVGSGVRAGTVTEGFNDITTLAASGWVTANNSVPVGTTTWFQGDPGFFNAQAGPNSSYIAANFNSAGYGGNISTWLFSPTFAIHNGDTFSFYTRTENPSPYGDHLELRLSTNGVSTAFSDFATTLAVVNPGPTANGYPTDWTLYTGTISGLGAGTTFGRFALAYLVNDTSANGDYIGIDSVTINGVVPAPEPSTLGLMGAALAAVAYYRSRRRN